MKAQTKIALRINDDNPNHHLWNNRGVWWCHVTVHKPDSTAERLRFSLKTRDIEKARARRDKIFASIQQHFRHCRLEKLSGEIKASHINLFYKNRSGSAGAVFYYTITKACRRKLSGIEAQALVRGRHSLPLLPLLKSDNPPTGHAKAGFCVAGV